MKQLLLSLFFVFSIIISLPGQDLVSSDFIEHRTVEQMQADFGVFMSWSVDLYKVTYTTPDIHGVIDTASGLVVVPVGLDRAFPLLLAQHGTVGSRDDVPSNLRGGYELAVVYGGLGYVSAAPDYLGLGESRGFHPYVHAETEASAGIDLLFAVRQQAFEDGFYLNEQLFIMGYSQGGHAAAAAHKVIQEEYETDFTVTASAPMSGPYSISGEMRKVMLSDEAYFFPAYIQYTSLSYNEVYGLYDNTEAFFKQPYADMMDEFYNENINLGTLNNMLISQLESDFGASITKNMIQDSVVTAMLNNENHPVNVALRANDVYDWVPEAPTRFYYCMSDEQVAFRNSIVVDSVMNANGAEDVMAIDINSDLDHGACVEPAITASIFFFASYQEIEYILDAEEEFDLSINAYPNPTTDWIYLIDVPLNATIELIDLNGKIQKRKLVDDLNPRLNVVDLPIGLYVLKVRSENQTWTEKVLIQK